MGTKLPSIRPFREVLGLIGGQAKQRTTCPRPRGNDKADGPADWRDAPSFDPHSDEVWRVLCFLANGLRLKPARVDSTGPLPAGLVWTRSGAH
jgi:hypothetical protein